MTQRRDLTVRQGETWSFTHTHVDASGSPVDLTGFSARMSIRTGFVGILKAYLSTGSDADGGMITLGGTAGTITMSMTSDQTRGFLKNRTLETIIEGEEEEPFEDFVYDLEIVNGSTVTRVLEGRFYIHRSITL